MNWSFLNTSILWALPLSLLPILFHFLFRKPPKIVAFSELGFLTRVYEQFRPRRRIKEWLILLLRMLILLCLFFFFSRPVLHWGGQAGSNDSVALVILLDSSYSMQASQSGISHWDQAITLAKESLRSLQESDRSALIVYSDQIDYFSGYLTNQHEELSVELNSFKPTYRGTFVLKPLQMAYRLLSNSGASNKSILILSDMAQHGWRSSINSNQLTLSDDFVNQIKEYDASVRILYPEFSPIRRNISIQNVRLNPDPYINILKIQVDLENTGTESISNVPLVLDFYDSTKKNFTTSHLIRQSEMTVKLGVGEKKTITLSAPLPEDHSISGRISLRSDDLEADNHFYVTQPAPRKVKILFVEEPSGIAALSGESYYFRQALVTPPSPFDVTTVSMGRVKHLDLDRYDTLVLINPSQLKPQDASAINGFIKRGGSLFLTLGERSKNFIKPSQGTKQFLKHLPTEFLEPRITDTLDLMINPEIETADLKTFEKDYEWDKIIVNKIIQPIIKESAEPWILLDDGTPLLIFSRDLKKAVWTTSINRDWTNIASKPIFVPLSRFILNVLSQQKDTSAVVQLKTGETFKRIFRKIPNRNQLKLLNPKGEKETLEFNRTEMTSLPLKKPGIYSFVSAQGFKDLIEEIPVNRSTMQGESFGTQMERSNLEKLLPKSRFVKLDSGEDFIAQFVAALRGKELSRFFILFAGVFLLGEAWMARRKK